MRYYIGKNGQQLGPFEDSAVREQLASGAISPDDLCWREGMAAWAPVREVFSPSADFPPPPPAPFVSSVTRETPPVEPQLADRGKRLSAVLLDSLIALFIATPGLVLLFAKIRSTETTGRPAAPEELLLGAAVPMLVLLIPILVFLVYQTWLLSSRGQTLGKKILKIRIVRTDGTNPGFMHAVLLRSFVMQLIGAIPVVGGIVSLVDPLLIFREDRRCLHDMIADTTVIDA